MQTYPERAYCGCGSRVRRAKLHHRKKHRQKYQRARENLSCSCCNWNRLLPTTCTCIPPPTCVKQAYALTLSSLGTAIAPHIYMATPQQPLLSPQPQPAPGMQADGKELCVWLCQAHSVCHASKARNHLQLIRVLQSRTCASLQQRHAPLRK